MKAKVNALNSGYSRQQIFITALFFMLFALSFKTVAAEAPAAESKNQVGEAFKRHGEYINPNGDGYPTAVKVEYVMGCLTANGMDLDNLTKCSCSIDYIAAQLPYDDYIKADTVLRARLDQGTKGAVFRESNWSKEIVSDLQSLQSASSLECF